MSADDWIKIIFAFGAVVITPVLGYLTLRQTKKLGEAVAEVHTVVNSKNDALVKEIKDLTTLVAELKQDKINLVAANQ